MPGKSKSALAAGGINGVRRTIMLQDLERTAAIQHVANFYIGDELIGLKPHPKTPGRTRRERRRRDASSVKFAEL